MPHFLKAWLLYAGSSIRFQAQLLKCIWGWTTFNVSWIQMLKCLLRSWVSALLKVPAQPQRWAFLMQGESACRQLSHNQANLGFILHWREKKLRCRKLPSLLWDRQTKRNAVEKNDLFPHGSLHTEPQGQTLAVGYLITKACFHPRRLSVVSRAPSLSSRSEMQAEVWFPAPAEKTFKLDKSWYYFSTLRAIFCQKHI